MNPEKIIEMLKSSVEEDQIIALNLLLNNFSESEMIGIFDKYGGNYPKTMDMLSEHSIKLVEAYSGDWRYYYRENIGFYVGHYLMIVKHPHKHNTYWKPKEI